MIEYTDGILKNLKIIDKEFKCGWLEKLNANLTLTQGKVKPHEIFSNKNFLEGISKKINKKPSRSSNQLSEKIKDRGWATEFYTESVQLWAWSLNKVIYKIPPELFDQIHDTLPLDKIPSDPLFRLPQWSTAIALNVEGIPSATDKYVQRFMIFSICLIDGKEYLDARVYLTAMDENGSLNENKSLSTVFFVSRDSATIEEGIMKAEQELSPILKNAEGRCAYLKYDFGKDTINDMLNAILFINGEHSKTQLGKNTEKWIGVSQIQSGYKIKPRVNPIEQEVGAIYLKEARVFKRASGARASHFRKGHFTTYWLGPRSGPRTSIVHWIPPMVVKGSVTDK